VTNLHQLTYQKTTT